MDSLPSSYKPKNKMSSEPQWFAMRATYRSELDMKERLEATGLRCFVPMKNTKKVVRGRIIRASVPAINSLIFVYGTQCEIQEFKISHPRLQYMIQVEHTTKTSSIITIPTKQMEAFITVCESNCSDIRQMDSDFKPGMRVRICQGAFEGLEGTFQRIKGTRERRFVISITGVALVTTTVVSADMIQPLD